jgi:recombination protein RecA
MASAEEVMASLGSDPRFNAVFGNTIEVVRLPTPSAAMTHGLNGGFAFGRMAMIWGPKSAGKSTFATQLLALAQSLGYSGAYLDVEGTYDPEWGARLGVNNDELIYADAKTVNKMVDTSIALMQADVDVLVVDSITALIPATFLEDDKVELKPMAKTGAIAGLARDMSHALPMLSYANKNTFVLLVSQSRKQQKGAMYWGDGPTGGGSVPFYCSQVINLWTSESKQNTIMGEVVNGDQIIEKPIGRKVKWFVEYNKIGPDRYEGEYDLIYEGDIVGVDDIGEVLDAAVLKGTVRKGGAWYYFGEQKLGQGRNNATKFLREEKEVFQAIKATL